MTDTSGTNPSLTSEGFSFSPPPLVLNGQNVGGGLNFTAQNAVAQVDQASQAYNFITNLNAGAYNFVSGATNSVLGFTGPLFNSIIGSLGTIGTAEAQAMNTAASKLGSSGCSGGFLSCLF